MMISLPCFLCTAFCLCTAPPLPYLLLPTRAVPVRGQFCSINEFDRLQNVANPQPMTFGIGVVQLKSGVPAFPTDLMM